MFDARLKYGILGLAKSGIAAAKMIKELGGTAFLSEAKSLDEMQIEDELLADFDSEFGGHTDKVLDCDTIIVSPGIPLDVPILQKARANGIRLISEIEFGYQIKAPDSQIIAVSGSNGKSTIVSLIQHILSQMGKKSILAGNIGSAFCSYPIHRPGLEYIVLEISSFQLDLVQSFRPHLAIISNITPDHLNRYDSFDAYRQSKMRIFAAQTAADFAILNKDCPVLCSHLEELKAQKRYFSLSDSSADAFLNDYRIILQEHELYIPELRIKGPHNHQNTMAALLAIQALGLNLEAAIYAAKSFKALPHRLEYVDNINGVFFYNDSKATNCDSVRSALYSFEKPIRIIMGGSDKGEDFNVLTQDLIQHAAKVYISGETHYKMHQAWLGKLPIHIEDDFKDIIYAAYQDAKAGDVIVLSPACASFDKFQNFEHRGDTFKKIVKELKREEESL